ncbi:dehydrogenase/reductase SDR family member 7B isoform X1 [Rhinatrema bivittatum]|uniref:dehydrogenase/reductase SDR family member 7B isoform X1 n=2 Tax=Rhinatrema bivittatum TaxID=194408 RepID=UPI00112BE75D|nr:dehydrogenase/reductase SDR family member 7B isoform X1 [Rhinatrema bivittatum]
MGAMLSERARRQIYKGKLMDITSLAIVPLLLGSLGLFALYRLLQRLRTRAYLQDAVVVITGASSGLGKECAKVFHASGCRLVLCGRDEERLQELVRELTSTAKKSAKTHKPHTMTFDLSDTEAVLSAAEEMLKWVGHVDILINNAGISYRGTILDTELDVDKILMETNYFGPVALTKALLPSMIKRKSGHIVVISSVQGRISIPFRSAYAASKHATQAFFDCLRAEVQQYEIDVTVVSPGYIQTNLSLNAVTANGSRYGVMDKNTAEGRAAEDVAKVVLTAVGEKKKEVLIAGLLPTLAVYLRTLVPKVFFTLMAARAKKERKIKDS